MANLNDVIERLKAEGDLNRNSGTNSNKVIINEIDLTNVTLKRIADSMQSLIGAMSENYLANSSVVEKSDDDEKDPNEIIQERSGKIDDERDENELLNAVLDIRAIMLNEAERPSRKNKDNDSSVEKEKEKRKIQASFSGFLKAIVLALGANIFLGPSAGLLLGGVGLAIGNPFLILVGALATIVDLLVNGNAIQELQKWRDGEQTIGTTLNNIFGLGENGLITRIGEQIRDLYEAIVPEDVRIQISQTLDDMSTAFMHFKNIVLLLAEKLGLLGSSRVTAEEILLEQTGKTVSTNRLGMYTGDEFTVGEAKQFLTREQLKDIIYRNMAPGLKRTLGPRAINQLINETLDNDERKLTGVETIGVRNAIAEMIRSEAILTSASGRTIDYAARGTSINPLYIPISPPEEMEGMLRSGGSGGLLTEPSSGENDAAFAQFHQILNSSSSGDNITYVSDSLNATSPAEIARLERRGL